MASPGEQPNQDASDSIKSTDLAFTVDTHLLRELGALLVGRNSTAVVELIKNAYDADASRVVVHGEALDQHGLITITDDGHGMTQTDFEKKFLRIAGRSKEGGSRRSPTYQRRFTGAKGIGRLSAHKLGSALRVQSTPDNSVLGRDASEAGFSAHIDWQAIEDSTASIEQTKAIRMSPAEPNHRGSGTTFNINRLHSEWSTAQLNQFLREVRSTRADPAIIGAAPDRLFPGDALLSEIQVSDAMKKDPGFVVELSGAFAGTEAQWPTLLSHTNWMIEIDARGDVVRYRMTPSLLTRKQNPTAQAKNFSSKRQPGAPEFVARIFVRDGSTTGNKLPQLLDRFAKESSGIRVYSEGFRVLPYGSPRNDWLGIDADYAQRANLAIDEADSPELSGDEIAITQGNERVYVRPGSSYFGGVFLLDETSHGLEMVINREGYLPNSSFDQMTSIIRRGVDLAVRVRAAVGIATKQDDDDRKKREQEKERDKLLDQHASLASSTPLKSMSPIQRLDTWVGAGRSAATALRASTSSSSSEVRQMVGVLSAAIEEVNSVAETARDEQAQIRVLASIGTQMGAFVHEINGVLGQARVIMERLGQLIDSHPESARELRAVRKAQAEMIASLERQAVYLSDSLDAESRRRRARQIVKDRVATAFRLLGPTAAGRQVELIDLTDANAKTPPMFPAEVNVILTNLLSNAIKAASTAPEGKRKIRVYATRGEQSTLIRVSNTGTSVDLDDSDRWFRPFESTTSNIDTVLGQGLGLGLSLTRRIVEEYGGTIQFVEPDDTFATAIDVTLPTR